ncbi:MAG: hypothetical protein E3J86_10580 [Candidatus Thorarchaeota archaeon]|nr:MAG: hypothetical protein E3J86_10580 [Candidatus Thorarchaeota archaeon]
MPYWNIFPKPLSQEALKETLDYYHEIADSPGDIVIPYYDDVSQEYTELCEELGVTWLLACDLNEKNKVTLDVDRIKEGPRSF